MSRFLSLIDPVALATALARAGVRTAKDPSPAIGYPEAESATSPGQTREDLPSTNPPSVLLGSAIRPDLKEFNSISPPATHTRRRHHLSDEMEQQKHASEQIPDLPAIFLEATSENATAASNRLDSRLEGYMAWIEQCTQCSGVFVVDEEGLVLMEKGSDPTLVALSAYFLRFQDRIRSLETQIRGSIAIDLEGENILYVVQADTHLGLHALGFTVTKPIMPNTIQRFQTALPYVFHRVQ